MKQSIKDIREQICYYTDECSKAFRDWQTSNSDSDWKHLVDMSQFRNVMLARLTEEEANEELRV